MMTWFLIGWLAALTLLVGLLAARGPAPNENRAQDDAAQAAYLAAWSARHRAPRNPKDQRQAVYDAFDRKAVR